MQINVNARILFVMDDGTILHWPCDAVEVDALFNAGLQIGTASELITYLHEHAVKAMSVMTLEKKTTIM
ncbi:hypothetical protein KIH77_07705 [Bifidobacterium sp. 82T24]|uniref:hypothetical protein n=1 Tax=Bifidobacterium pluvialisilvae TaxID=2834436 RepID=UPI001C56CC82|nr:hypothetical protein [Bifidobacterium pluvialisilvae]MBW3088611.1 hypothetical protein [Bifidobacterium pluvialisilvae]